MSVLFAAGSLTGVPYVTRLPRFRCHLYARPPAVPAQWLRLLTFGSQYTYCLLMVVHGAYKQHYSIWFLEVFYIDNYAKTFLRVTHH